MYLRIIYKTNVCMLVLHYPSFTNDIVCFSCHKWNCKGHLLTYVYKVMRVTYTNGACQCSFFLACLRHVMSAQQAFSTLMWGMRIFLSKNFDVAIGSTHTMPSYHFLNSTWGEHRMYSWYFFLFQLNLEDLSCFSTDWLPSTCDMMNVMASSRLITG